MAEQDIEQKFLCVKSYAFALRVVKLYQSICTEKREFVLSKQLLRSATSIGANIEEAFGTHLDKDFVAKLQIALKEARETHYWLRLMADTGYITTEVKALIDHDCIELVRLLSASLKTVKGDVVK